MYIHECTHMYRDNIKRERASEREREKEREERERDVILCIQIHKHVHREYEQRDTHHENEKNARTRNTHTHNVNVYTTYVSLPWCVARPKTRTRAPISTTSRATKSSYNESDICQQDFCPILSVSGNSV